MTRWPDGVWLRLRGFQRTRKLWLGDRMAAHWERVRGRLGADAEEAWGRNDERFTRFSLCCDSYEEGKTWYTMLGKNEIVDFVMRHLRKGNLATCEGEVTTKPYTDKTGRARLERIMRLSRVELPDGGSCEATDPEPSTINPEEAERLYWEKRAEDLAAYPPRWERRRFFETPGGFAAFERNQKLWTADSPVHEPMADVPSEAIGQLIKELQQEMKA